MSSSKPKHQQAHDAVNTPPSRDPQLMHRMYTTLAKFSGDHRPIAATIVGSMLGLLPEDTLTISDAQRIPDLLFPDERPELLDLAPLDDKAARLSPEAHIALAAGYALHRSLTEAPGLVLAFIGEAQTLTPARDTLLFAATHQLPLVVVAQHNLAKLKSKESVADLSHEILGVGMPGMTIDGSDAMAVYRVTQEAMFRARHDGGPTLIECKTYPRKSVPGRFRPWVQGDALAYMEQQLRARDLWQDDLGKS